MNKILRAVLAVAASFTLALSMTAVSSAETYTGTVNLAKADRNLRGDGYTWNNPDNILTLDGLNIETSDDFGIKLPPASRVVLKGTNRIKAGKYGIGCPGSVIFEGNGTLIVEAGDAAVYSYSANDNHKIHFMDGKFELTGGKFGILSDIAEISVTGGDITSMGGTASAKGRVFTATGGSFKGAGGIAMDHLISINRGKLEIDASDTALSCGNSINLKNVKILAGDKFENLEEVEAYSGQASFRSVPKKGGGTRSMIFGDNYPAIVDYAVMSGAALLVASVIAVPILHKKRKTKKMYESLKK